MVSVKAISLKMQEDRKAMPGHRSSATLINCEHVEHKESHPASQLLIARFGMSEALANVVARLAYGERAI